MGKNDYFGERALLFDEPRSASIVVNQSGTSLWAMSKANFLEIMQGSMLSHIEYRIRLQNTFMAFDDLETEKTVGRGTFGTVKLVFHKETKTRYALKCVKKSVVRDKRQEVNICMERELLAENDHPFIVHLVKTFKDDKYL